MIKNIKAPQRNYAPAVLFSCFARSFAGALSCFYVRFAVFFCFARSFPAVISFYYARFCLYFFYARSYPSDISFFYARFTLFFSFARKRTRKAILPLVHKKRRGRPLLFCISMNEKVMYSI